MSPIARRTLLLGLAGSTAALAGCTGGVPTSGPVSRVSAVPGRINPGVEIAPEPPGGNATPIEVVEGFLHAMASWQPDYTVARAYLTPQAAATWRPDAGVRIYAEGNPVSASDTGARLRAPLVGALDPSGAYRQTSGTLDHDFGLVQDAAGQWRIGNPPDGLVVSQYLFTSTFTRITAYFFAPGGRWLVPDPRYHPRGHQAYEGAARAVLGGATDWLEPAVEPTQSWARPSGVSVSPSGVARILLEPGVGEPSEEQRAALAAQLVWTFRQFESVTAIELAWAGEEPWQLPTYGRTIPVTAFPEVDPSARQGSRQLFAIIGGRLVRPLEGPQGMDSLVVAPAVVEASFGAVRSDALLAAAVVADRHTLEVAPLGEATVREARTAIGLRRPHFSRQGALWVNNDAGQLSVASGLEWRDLEVGGLGDARVSTFRVAPDGVRVAIVAQRPGGEQVVGIARVEGDGPSLRIEGWRELEVSATAVAPVRVVDVGWRSPESLLVLTGDAKSAAVLAVDQEGATVAPIGPTALTDPVELAVAPGVPAMLRTASGDVWRYNSDFRWSLHLQGVASVFYPG